MKKVLGNAVVAAFILVVATVSSCVKDKECKYKRDQGAGADYLPAYLSNCTAEAAHEVPPVSPASGKVFSYTKFEQLLLDSLTDVGGYQIAVTENGFPKFLKSAGYARETNECPDLVMTGCNKVNIASVTKILTIATTLKILDDLGMDETDSIGPYLPASWTVPAAVANTTFAALFRHRSGMQSTNNDFQNTLSYNGLRTFVANGPIPANVGTFNYLNANVALMRIVIPELWKGLASCPAALKNAGEITDALSQTYYERAVKEFVLNKVNAEGELDAPTALGDFETLYYTPTSSEGGASAGNWKNICGGGGWNMTANDLAKVMEGIFNGTIVSSVVLTQMQNLGMGLLNQITVTDGTLFGHSGDVSFSGGKEYHSIALYNPNNGLAIAVNINCGFKDPNNGGWLGWIVQRAYNGAWE